MSVHVSPELTPDLVAARKHAPLGNQVVFGVKALYGLSPRSVTMPLNERETIESGQIAAMIDPDVDPSFNIGIVDFDKLKLKVCYGIQMVFPGMARLIADGQHDPSLLN